MFTPGAPVQHHPPEPVSQTPSWNTAPTKQSYPAMPNQAFGGVVTNQPYGSSTPMVPGQFAPTIPAPPLQSQPLDPYGNHYNQLQPSVPPPPPPTASTNSNLSSSRPPSVGPHSRSKYILDPSVKSSGPAYGSSYSQSQQMYGGSQQQTFASSTGFSAQSPYQVY